MLQVRGATFAMFYALLTGSATVSTVPGFPNDLRMKPIRTFLADDHPDVLEKLASLLGQPYDIVGLASDGQTVIDGVQRLGPELLVLDISMPGMSGIEAVEKLKKSSFDPVVVFLTVHADSDFLRAALTAGAFGYVLKARLATDLLPAIEAALAGQIFISPFPTLKK